jgi:hypothetical protein
MLWTRTLGNLSAPKASPCGQTLLDEPANDVPRGYVQLLNERRLIRRDPQAHIAEGGHLAAGPPGEPHHCEAFLARTDRPQNIRRAARGRDRDQNVAGAAFDFLLGPEAGW